MDVELQILKHLLGYKPTVAVMILIVQVRLI